MWGSYFAPAAFSAATISGWPWAYISAVFPFLSLMFKSACAAMRAFMEFEKSSVTSLLVSIDSGFDPGNSLLMTDDGRLDPRIKGVQNFVHQTEPFDIQDEIGHGTHALGLLLKVATCAEIYIARVANRETLGRDSYDAITKARLAPYQSKFYT